MYSGLEDPGENRRCGWRSRGGYEEQEKEERR